MSANDGGPPSAVVDLYWIPLGAGAHVVRLSGKLYEAITDPEVPPLPPHITFEQARHFMTALPGDPDRGAVVKQSFRQKIEELLPGR